jgi:hypothetical protein
VLHRPVELAALISWRPLPEPDRKAILIACAKRHIIRQSEIS